MLNVTIKPVSITDAATLLNLSRRLFFDFFAAKNDPANMEAYASVAFTLPKIESEINNPGSSFYFACLGDDIIGYLKLNAGTAQNEFKETMGLEVERIYVDPSYVGNKIGQQLLNFAINIAISQQCTYIWLGVWEHNQNAIRFYERHGFTLTGSHDFMLGNEKQTDLLMRRELV